VLSQRSLRLVILGSILLITACQKELPTSPSDLWIGIVVYEHANFQGESAHIVSDLSDLEDFKGPCGSFHYTYPYGTTTYSWDDCISSVRVAPGWSATLYRDPDYDDDQVTVTNDVPDLTALPHDCSEGGLNDCVSSIRIRRP
jgi:hypothetical protein